LLAGKTMYLLLFWKLFKFACFNFQYLVILYCQIILKHYLKNIKLKKLKNILKTG